MTTCLKPLLSCCGLLNRSETIRPNTISGASTSQMIPVITFSNMTNHDLSTVLTTIVPKKKQLAQINTSFTMNDIISAEVRGNNYKEQLKYNCPICFCFFNKILEVKCCKNYICHGCASALNQRIQKDTKTHVVSCPFCSLEDLVIQDVDPQAELRHYTDTPYLQLSRAVSRVGPGSEGERSLSSTMRKGFAVFNFRGCKKYDKTKDEILTQTFDAFPKQVHSSLQDLESFQRVRPTTAEAAQKKKEGVEIEQSEKRRSKDAETVRTSVLNTHRHDISRDAGLNQNEIGL